VPKLPRRHPPSTGNLLFVVVFIYFVVFMFRISNGKRARPIKFEPKASVVPPSFQESCARRIFRVCAYFEFKSNTYMYVPLLFENAPKLPIYYTILIKNERSNINK